MARKITMSLSTDSIQKAIDELNKYSDELTYKARLLAEKLAEQGVEIARVQISDLNAVFRGELLASINASYVGSMPSGGIWAVVAGSDHAIFVEFGTGIVGKGSPYPGKLPDGVSWEYASGKTIHQLSDGRYGWFYPVGDKKDKKWYFTEGMPSRPFMLMTANELKRKVKAVAKEVFG
jgi:hypothetical protein|nr:MAG TPA_asm: tail component protein [Caudoviricetes sp.]